MVTLPVLLRDGEDGWLVAECPMLAGCISQGRTRDEALANIREAIELSLEAGDQPRSEAVSPAPARHASLLLMAQRLPHDDDPVLRAIMSAPVDTRQLTDEERAELAEAKEHGVGGVSTASLLDEIEKRRAAEGE